MRTERPARKARAAGRRAGVIATAFAAAAMLSGCSHVSGTSATRIGDRDMRNRVELVRILQPISGDEKTAMAQARAFLEQLGFGYGDRLAFEAGPRFPAGLKEDMGRLVRAYGGALVAAPPLPTVPPPEGALLVVERYRVTSPQCPARRLDLAHNPGNAPAPQFGCANLLNLGAMVAAPEHLLAGVPAGANDAERARAAIEAWHESPIVILEPKATTESASSGE